MLLQLHVALSMIGIITGLVSLTAMLSGRLLAGWTLAFIVTTTLTSVTGFPLPPFGFDPARIVGLLSLVVLGAATIGLYVFVLVGVWLRIYVVAAITALFLNCFVAVVQAFQKVPVLRALAPTQSEPPFVLAIGLLLVFFAICGTFALHRFHAARRKA